MRRTCYNFEPSGHRFEPLDGYKVDGTDFVCRLFCPRCGRISVASTDNNTAFWNVNALPPESQTDFMSNPLVIRKTDA